MSFTQTPPSRLNTPRLDRQKDRIAVRDGDIVYFHHENAHALIDTTASNGDVKWIDTPTVDPQEYTTDDVDQLLELETAYVIDTGFRSREYWLDYSDVVLQYDQTEPKDVSPGGAPNTKALTLKAERGAGSKYRTNGFLKHPDINYQGKPIGNGSKMALTAQWNGNDVAMAILGKPIARLGWDDGTDIQLLKFAAHPNRPANTGSWLLSRCCEWAALEGYDTFLTYAGAMNDNEGTMYAATNFELYDVEENHDGDGWKNREGRGGSGTYSKRTWIRSLSDNHELESRRRKGRQYKMSNTLSQWMPTETEQPTIADFTLTREEPLEPTDDAVTDFIETHGDGTPINTEDVVAVFGARSGSKLAAALVVTDPTDHYNHRDNFDRVCISHFAADDVRYPTNVARWLTGKARRWAYLHGYHTIDAVTPNAGSTDIYAGAQFNREAAVLSDGGDNADIEDTARWRQELRSQTN